MTTRTLALGALGALALACQAPRPTQAASADAAAAAKGAPVARFSGTVVTAEELDKAVRNQLAELEQKAYDARRQGLEQLVDEKLLEAKAKAAGTDIDGLLKKEVAAKMSEPTDEEARALYERAKADGQQLPPFDKVKGQVVEYVKRQKGQELVRQYLEQLRAEAKVEILLPPYLPPKVEVSADGPSRGPADAPITIVEFSDYQCPYCGKAEPTVNDLLELQKYKGKVRLVYRDYPLPGHPLAPKAAEAAHCAADQDKYWQMHGKLFASQPKLEPADLKAYARELGLDGARFDKCLDSGEKAQVVERHAKAGRDAGVNGTPAFFINGRLVSGARPIADFTAIIDAELAAAARK